MRGGEPELELSMGRVREIVGRRERESDLNAVGPKTTSSGQTGQTGRPYRSDRSGMNWPRADRNKFGASSRGLKLMTRD